MKVEEDIKASNIMLAYLCLKVSDWSRFLGYQKLFDEFYYPLTREKLQFPIESYLPIDFFHTFQITNGKGDKPEHAEASHTCIVPEKIQSQLIV